MTCILKKKLDKQKMFGNLRELKIPPASNIDFVSNDYLGPARSAILSDMVEAEICLITNHIYASTGSRLLTGNFNYVEELEDRIAAFHGYEAGLIFNCGYMANTGLLSKVLDSTSARPEKLLRVSILLLLRKKF